MSRIQGLGWIQLFSWRALQSPRRKCLILPSPEEGWPQAMRGCSCPRDGDAGGCATLHPKCPGHLLKFSCTRCSLRYCSSDSRNFMSGMMDCSKRRGHWGGQGGHIQQAREDPRGAPCHGQAVPGVVLLLTWAFWVPKKDGAGGPGADTYILRLLGVTGRRELLDVPGNALFQLPGRNTRRDLDSALRTSLPLPSSIMSPSQEHCGLQDTLGESALGRWSPW